MYSTWNQHPLQGYQRLAWIGEAMAEVYELEKDFDCLSRPGSSEVYQSRQSAKSIIRNPVGIDRFHL